MDWSRAVILRPMIKRGRPAIPITALSASNRQKGGDKYGIDWRYPEGKKEDRAPKKQQPQKPKKQKKVSITLDTSLDKKPRGNYRGQGGGNSYQGGKKEKQQAPSLKPHQEYVDNANAPKAAVSAYNFVPFTRTVLASPLDAMKMIFAATLKVKRPTAEPYHWNFLM